MSRIDHLFSDGILDEARNPSERLEQLIGETGWAGTRFAKLLHLIVVPPLSNNIDELERCLCSIRRDTPFKEQTKQLLRNAKLYNNDLFQELNSTFNFRPDECEELKKLACEIFPDSPLEYFDCVYSVANQGALLPLDKSIVLQVCCFYGNNFCKKPDYFNKDVEGYERHVEMVKALLRHPFGEKLRSESIMNPSEQHQIALGYLRAWGSSVAERPPEECRAILEGIIGCLDECFKDFSRDKEILDKPEASGVLPSFEDIKSKVVLDWTLAFNPHSAPLEDFIYWTQVALPFGNQLSSVMGKKDGQLLIHRAVDESIRELKTLGSRASDHPEPLQDAVFSRFCLSPFRESFYQAFLEKLDGMPAFEKFQVLLRQPIEVGRDNRHVFPDERIPLPSECTEGLEDTSGNKQYGLFFRLPEKWSKEKRKRLEALGEGHQLNVDEWMQWYEAVDTANEQDSSKYIGLTRKRLRESGKSDGIRWEACERAFRILDKESWQKGLSQRLLLFRFLKEPGVDADLAAPPQKLSLSEFSFSQNAVADVNRYFEGIPEQINPCFEVELSWEKREENLEDARREFRHALVEFFLDNLELRKMERPGESGYESTQMKEVDALWRLGYIKALQELGFNLGGKVHRKMHFIWNNDPDESVRDVAKQCYRSIRNSQTDLSERSHKRAMRAAFWWLRLVHRQSLGFEVDVEGARRTRRRELRSL